MGVRIYQAGYESSSPTIDDSGGRAGRLNVRRSPDVNDGIPFDGDAAVRKELELVIHGNDNGISEDQVHLFHIFHPVRNWRKIIAVLSPL